MPIFFVKSTVLKRAACSSVAALVFSLGSAVHLAAATVTFSYVSPVGMDGTLTYIDNPAVTNPAHDSFFSQIISPQLGAGSLSVPNDFTNYMTATGHANASTFTFASGTFSGSVDSVLNLAVGSVVLTYTITNGTGAFYGASGTVTEAAHFTSFGNFSPNIPATVAIDSGGGTLTLSPEPGTMATLMVGLGLLGYMMIRLRTA